MEILYNELLSKYTTIRIGGYAKKMFIPENIEELNDIILEYPKCYVLGGGSNLLIANKEFECVINMKKLDTSIIDLGSGRYKVGASVRLQRLIKQVNDAGYGGIEYLYSVPGLVGGAVFMNAGSGLATGFSISDSIESVTCLYEGNLVTLDKSSCEFKHRNSIFRTGKYIIVSVVFCFFKMDSKECEKRRIERINYCRRYQDTSAPNFGSVFKYSNYRIMRIVQLFSIGKKNGVHYSKKSGNWLINEGNKNDYSGTIRLIKFVQFLHRILGKKCEIEVEIWN